MLSTLIKTIQSQYSGVAARDHVARIARHHRIQASPGFRAAAHEVKGMLDTLGLGGEIITMPAQEGIQYWGQQGFQEWEARRATLHLVEPADAATRLCDFREVKLSLIQRSAPTPPVEAEVVLLEDGTTPQEYAALDVRDKIVLTNGAVDRVRELAVERHGALQTSATLALYWADGQRSVAQIADLVEMESDSRDIEYLVRYFRLLEAVGLVRMAS